jgi:phosphonate ABC transporter permease subunit PhnE
MMGSTPPSTRTTLKRLVFILLFALILGIFSYGWAVTDIDLSVPQEAQRQERLSIAMRELFSPNIFEQDYNFEQTQTTFLMSCATGQAPAENTAATDGAPYIIVSPTCAEANETITVQGFNFKPEALARIDWIPEGGEARVSQPVGTNEDNFLTNPDGTFTIHIEVPQIRGSSGEVHTVQARTAVPTGSPRFTEMVGLVGEKMIETIFLALIATVLSILPSAILSFFAAHNLMKSLHISSGNLLVSVALLPVGWALGVWGLSQIGLFSFNLGKGTFFGAGTAAIIVFAAVASTQKLKQIEVIGWEARARSIGMSFITAIAVMAFIGFIGGFGVLGYTFFSNVGNSFRPAEVTNVTQWLINALSDGLTSFGILIRTLGELIELLLLPIAGVIGALSASSIGTNMTTDLLKRVDSVTSHVIGGVLGAICGAFLLGVVAFLGTQAAWLGLLAPLISGWLCGALLTMGYKQMLGKPKPGVGRNQFLISALWWIGFLGGFLLTFSVLNVGRAIVEGTLPVQFVVANVLGVEITLYIAKAMLIGGIFAGAAGVSAGAHATFPLGEVLYNTTRTILNSLRSIEPLIMGIVFVIWVGIGPFAGVLALTLHSIASLGKLFSEQIENIDAGPIEALQSTGANQLQTIMYAVVPQIIPPYIAFTMYRWDINVRMSTIIGFVGGGGIGFLLQQQINLSRYGDAGVAVLAIAIVVTILDYASASIRQRYI